MIRSSLLARWAIGLMVLLAGSASLPAVDITYDLSTIAPWNQATASLTSGGYTLRFGSNINFLIGSGGANFGIAMDRDVTFTIQKTAGPTDLIFKSYKTGYVTNTSGNTISFDLTGGTGTSNGNLLPNTSTSNYNGSYSLVGSQVVTFSPQNFGATNNDNLFMTSLTFSTVPEPSTYALAAIATGVMAAIARRRKARRA